jgi:hypothetical protein
MAGPGVNVAGAIGRGLAFGLGVGLAVGLMVGIGDGVAGPARLATTVGLGVAVLPQATTTSSRHKIEPIRARRPVRTLSSQIAYIGPIMTPHPPLLLCGSAQLTLCIAAA